MDLTILTLKAIDINKFQQRKQMNIFAALVLEAISLPKFFSYHDAAL